MPGGAVTEGHTFQERKKEILEKYRSVAIAREVYLLRRQRKTVLEKCRRIAVVGASLDPHSASSVSTEKLLGLGIEVAPILPGCERYLGLPCYANLHGVPGKIDIVQIYTGEGNDLIALATQAVEKGVTAFWVEEGLAGTEVEEILGNGKVQLVEHESLEREYAKHLPFPESVSTLEGKQFVRVRDRMTKHPVTVRPADGINEAIDKMKKGHFRHLPVVDDGGQLIGMLSDRDIRLIRPSRAFCSAEEAAEQLWSTAVRQAAVFDPITIPADALLERAAALMLRWQVGGLPVVDEGGLPVGIITYTDLLREFVAREGKP